MKRMNRKYDRDGDEDDDDDHNKLIKIECEFFVFMCVYFFSNKTHT